MGTCVSTQTTTSGAVETDSDLSSGSRVPDVAAPSMNSPGSILARLASRPEMVTRDHFVSTLDNPSCFWVYARFSDQNNCVNQFLYALDIKEKKYVPLPNPPMNTLVGNASAVLDSNLYIMGGQRRSHVHNFVHVFQPVLHDWFDNHDLNILPRREALAASVNGRVYAFGGCDAEIARWGEVYDPSTQAWTPIPSSEDLIHALDNGLYSLRTCAVLGTRIILRGSGNAIAFDVPSSSWIAVSARLIGSWWNCIRAAVVQNLLITCHSHYDDNQIQQLSIRAYDPDEDVWLLIDGMDTSFHKNAYRSHFLSVKGKLVIYHMWKKNDLRYSVFEIKQKRRASITVDLLCKSRFSITKIIKQGNKCLNLSSMSSSSTGRPLKSIFVPSVMEAVRADD